MANQDIRNVQEVSYEKALKYAIFLGWVGADRFYIGDTGFGVLKAISLSFYGVFWIADIIIIKSHKSDWDEWISAKQAKRASKKAEAQAVKEKHRETGKLHKERAANGQCPKCGSDRLSAVSKVTPSVGNALMTLGSGGRVPLVADKSKVVRVCLNCGNQF